MIYSTTNQKLHVKELKEFVNWCEKVVGTGGHQGGHCFDAYRIISANPPSEPLVGRKFLQLFDE